MMPAEVECTSTYGKRTRRCGDFCMDDALHRDSDRHDCRSRGCVCRFLGVLLPSISESRYLIPPIYLSAHYALTLSSAQLVALLVIGLLTATNTLGIEYGKIIQNTFTVAKLGALAALILVGPDGGLERLRGTRGPGQFLAAAAPQRGTSGLFSGCRLGLLMVFCVSQSGSLFARMRGTTSPSRRKKSGSQNHSAPSSGDRRRAGDA